jgi:hypothetical protein
MRPLGKYQEPETYQEAFFRALLEDRVKLVPEWVKYRNSNDYRIEVEPRKN